jgi:hypothetical protein
MGRVVLTLQRADAELHTAANHKCVSGLVVCKGVQFAFSTLQEHDMPHRLLCDSPIFATFRLRVLFCHQVRLVDHCLQ